MANSPAPYTWRDLRFTAPAGLDDETLVTFTAADRGFNLTVSRDVLAGAVSAYGAAQESALKGQKLRGYVAVGVTTRTTGAGRPVAVHERQLKDGGGRDLIQLQAFVDVGSTPPSVAVITATGLPARRKVLEDAMNQVLGSLETG